MIDERTQRVSAAAKQAGASWAMLTQADSVCYAVGHEARIEVGPSPVAGGPNVAFVGPSGETALLVINSEAGAAANSRAEIVHTYAGTSLDPTTDVHANYRQAVSALLAKLPIDGTIAVEPASLPHSLEDVLAARSRQFVNITPALSRLRMTKTKAEVDMLRHCAEVTAVGQQRLREIVRPGLTELEIFGQVRTAMEVYEGQRLPIIANVLCGIERSAGYHGWPGLAVAREGEPILCDLAPRARGGYWGDSCATIVPGEPGPQLRAMYQAVYQAFELALSLLQPGTCAGDVDARVRSLVQQAGYSYPHHTGHSIGAAQHEPPYLIPDMPTVLEPGNVLLIEPGAYDPEIGGIRLEWMVLLTEAGAEVLNAFPLALDVFA